MTPTNWPRCIDLYLQRGDPEAAQRWFDMLEKLDPKDHNIEHWRFELKRSRRLQSGSQDE